MRGGGGGERRKGGAGETLPFPRSPGGDRGPWALDPTVLPASASCNCPHVIRSRPHAGRRGERSAYRRHGGTCHDRRHASAEDQIQPGHPWREKARAREQPCACETQPTRAEIHARRGVPEFLACHQCLSFFSAGAHLVPTTSVAETASAGFSTALILVRWLLSKLTVERLFECFCPSPLFVLATTVAETVSLKCSYHLRRLEFWLTVYLAHCTQHTGPEKARSLRSR